MHVSKDSMGWMKFFGWGTKQGLSFQKNLQNFSDYPSHRIFRRMHEVLNIDENKN